MGLWMVLKELWMDPWMVLKELWMDPWMVLKEPWMDPWMALKQLWMVLKVLSCQRPGFPPDPPGSVHIDLVTVGDFTRTSLTSLPTHLQLLLRRHRKQSCRAAAGVLKDFLVIPRSG